MPWPNGYIGSLISGFIWNAGYAKTVNLYPYETFCKYKLGCDNVVILWSGQHKFCTYRFMREDALQLAFLSQMMDSTENVPRQEPYSLSTNTDEGSIIF